MSGFGFSPSDIVEFGKFAIKVRTALNDDGGSVSEYQDAISWCESFQDVLKEIQNLELSNVSVVFADKLQEQSKHTGECIVAFKKKVAKYEKALGENAKKGMQNGTTRKVQWALMAAGDLNKFAQSLHLRIKSLEMFMASKTLANADQRPSLRIEAAKVGDSMLDLRESMVRMASQQDMVHSHLLNIFDEIRYLRSLGSPDLALRVRELTGMIMQLLGNRADIALLDGVPRVWTLPDTMEYDTEKEKVAVGSFSSPQSGDDDKTAVPSRDDRLGIGTDSRWASKRPTGNLNVGLLARDLANDKGWVRDSNEVLRALQLPEITVDDFKDPDRENNGIGIEGDTPVADAGRGQDHVKWDTGSANYMPKESSQRRGIQSKMRSGGLGSPVSGLETAANIVATTALITQISICSSNISKNKAIPKGLVRMFERLGDLTVLLLQVADLIATGEDLQGGHMILTRTHSLHEEILEKFKSISSTRKLIVVVMRWSAQKETIGGLLEEMESLKLTLSCMLQAHIVKIQNQSYREVVDGMNRVNQLEKSIHMLHDSIQRRAGNGKQPV